MMSLISIVLALVIEITGVGLPKLKSAFQASTEELKPHIIKTDSLPNILITNNEEQQEIKSK